MRRSNGLFESVGNYITHIAGPSLAHPKCRAWRLAKTWGDAVGPSLAVHTEPSRLSQGVLTIRVDSPVWMNQLTFLRIDLLEKFQQLWPDERITEIRLRPGPLQNGQEEPWQKKHSQLLVPTREEHQRAESLTEQILDPPLRTAVQRFLEMQMARHRMAS